MRVTLFSLCILIFFSCSNDNEIEQLMNDDDDDPSQGNPPSSISSIEPEFREFVSSFVSEMRSRGRDISATNLTVKFVDQITAAPNGPFCAYGYPNYNGTGKPAIEVLDTFGCWERWGTVQKENLMFHELGHALLNKGHYNEFMPNGMAKSIMCDSQNCNNYRTYNTFQTAQRTYYLDQLINPNILTLVWAGEKEFSRNIAADNFDNTLENWNFLIDDETSPNSYFFFVDTENSISPPNAIGITATSSADGSTFGYWFKDFEATNFQYCSNIVVSGDIITKDLTEGYVALVIDYMSQDENGELTTIDRHVTSLDNNSTGTNMFKETTAIANCITEEIEYIRICFAISTSIESSVFLDNLVVDLHE